MEFNAMQLENLQACGYTIATHSSREGVSCGRCGAWETCNAHSRSALPGKVAHCAAKMLCEGILSYSSSCWMASWQ